MVKQRIRFKKQFFFKAPQDSTIYFAFLLKIEGEFIALKYKSDNQSGEKKRCPEELISLFEFDINIAGNALYYFRNRYDILLISFHFCLLL
jgi:hypothetical protein